MKNSSTFFNVQNCILFDSFFDHWIVVLWYLYLTKTLGRHLDQPRWPFTVTLKWLHESVNRWSRTSKLNDLTLRIRDLIKIIDRKETSEVIVILLCITANVGVASFSSILVLWVQHFNLFYRIIPTFLQKFDIIIRRFL